MIEMGLSQEEYAPMASDIYNDLRERYETIVDDANENESLLERKPGVETRSKKKKRSNWHKEEPYDDAEDTVKRSMSKNKKRNYGSKK